MQKREKGERLNERGGREGRKGRKGVGKKKGRGKAVEDRGVGPKKVSGSIPNKEEER